MERIGAARLVVMDRLRAPFFDAGARKVVVITFDLERGVGSPGMLEE